MNKRSKKRYVASLKCANMSNENHFNLPVALNLLTARTRVISVYAVTVYAIS